MKSLLLIGAGGQGKVVADLAEHCGCTEIAFADDKWPGADRAGHWPIIGNPDGLSDLRANFDHALVSIGDSGFRLNYLGQLLDLNFDVPTLVHPSAAVSPYAKIDRGTVVFATAAINVDARLGRAVIINTGATVDHDVILGDGVHIAPGAHIAGNVEIGERTWVGIGAVVREGIKIGSDAMIGAGAAVVRDVPSGATVLGVPAKSRP